jgi:hypothetical protein
MKRLGFKLYEKQNFSSKKRVKVKISNGSIITTKNMT